MALYERINGIIHYCPDGKRAAVAVVDEPKKAKAKAKAKAKGKTK